MGQLVECPFINRLLAAGSRHGGMIRWFPAAAYVWLLIRLRDAALPNEINNIYELDTQ